MPELLVINSAGLGDVATPCDNVGLFSGEDAILACWNSKFYGTSSPSGPVLAAPPAPANIVTPVTGNDPAQVNSLIDSLIAEQGEAQQAIDAGFVTQTAPTLDACENFTLNWPISFTCSTLWLLGAGVAAVWLASQFHNPRERR